jgi:hypothetical protein
MARVRNVLCLLMLLLATQLYLTAQTELTSLLGVSAEDSEGDFELTVTGSSLHTQSSGRENDSIFQFYAPAGSSCEPDSESGQEQEPAAAVAIIPVKIAFSSRLLRIPGISTRPFHLKLVYKSEKEATHLYDVNEFNLEHATVTDGQDSQEYRNAELEVGVQLELPCGAYVARFFMEDHALQGTLAFSQDFFILVNASSYKYDFCYLVQAPTYFNTDHLTESKASFAMVLQWKHEGQQQQPSLFFPNSTWNQGRNALLAAVRRNRCRYYIFVDEDAELVHRHWDEDGAGVIMPTNQGDTWREFEQLLLKWRPSVAVPHVQWHSTNNSQASVVETIAIFDHLVLAVSSSVIDCMLPYETQWDLDALDYSVIPSYVISALLFPDQVVQFKSLSAVNKVAPHTVSYNTAVQFTSCILVSRRSLTFSRILATGPVTYCPSCARSCGLSVHFAQMLSGLRCCPPGFIGILACLLFGHQYQKLSRNPLHCHQLLRGRSTRVT